MFWKSDLAAEVDMARIQYRHHARMFYGKYPASAASNSLAFSSIMTRQFRPKASYLGASNLKHSAAIEPSYSFEKNRYLALQEQEQKRFGTSSKLKLVRQYDPRFAQEYSEQHYSPPSSFLHHSNNLLSTVKMAEYFHNKYTLNTSRTRDEDSSLSLEWRNANSAQQNRTSTRPTKEDISSSAMHLLASASAEKLERDKDKVTDWNLMYDLLAQFKKKHGHTRVPFCSSDDSLGCWVHEQRCSKRLLTHEERAKLDSLQFVWKVRDTWEVMYQRLYAYKISNGDCLVPQHYEQDPKLGGWVQGQRRCKKLNMLPEERISQLDAIGFVWRVKKSKNWEEMFKKLQQYFEKHGNCLVPTKWPEDPQLGMWINNQRRRHKTLSPERKKMLDSIGFVWSMYQRDSWNTMFERLVKYKEKHGDLCVPQYYTAIPKLGRWVDNQRFRKHLLSEDRTKLLDSIGFVWRVQR